MELGVQSAHTRQSRHGWDGLPLPPQRFRVITPENLLNLACKILHSGAVWDINIEMTEHHRLY
jgi:hypothetical protein